LDEAMEQTHAVFVTEGPGRNISFFSNWINNIVGNLVHVNT
jgi:hypothetical protein